mgnify:CR=1 FL=1
MFNFENDADEKIQGARIYAEIDDDTNGTEDGAMLGTAEGAKHDGTVRVSLRSVKLSASSAST